MLITPKFRGNNFFVFLKISYSLNPNVELYFTKSIFCYKITVLPIVLVKCLWRSLCLRFHLKIIEVNICHLICVCACMRERERSILNCFSTKQEKEVLRKPHGFIVIASHLVCRSWQTVDLATSYHDDLIVCFTFQIWKEFEKVCWNCWLIHILPTYVISLHQMIFHFSTLSSHRLLIIFTISCLHNSNFFMSFMSRSNLTLTNDFQFHLIKSKFFYKITIQDFFL